MIALFMLACGPDIPDFQYEMSHTEIDFGVVSIGIWQSYGVRLLNTGSQPFDVWSISFSDPAGDVWELQGDVEEKTLLSGEGAIIDIIFLPEEEKTYSNTVRFLTSLEGDDSISYVTVTGQGGNSIRDDDGDGYSVENGDCNDDNPSIYPGADEACDGLDTNCDGFTPPEENDGDNDGWRLCSGDCDDTDRFVYPNAPERCDGKDNDCNGIAEDAVDLDGDGQTECEGDCDDTEPTVMYGGLEICDFLDNDCDGLIDELDADNDGFSACWSGDCDDFDASSYPVVLDGNVEGIGEGTLAAPYKSLSTAFANLNPNCPTVLIVPGTHEIEGSWTQQGEVRLLGGGEYPEDTTIKPFPTNSRILRAFPNSSIVLENLTAFGGDSDVPGTILYAEDGTTSTLLNVEILDNQSTAQGGAISIFGGVLHTIDSTFSYNTAINGGAVYVESGEYIDEGSSFIANEATNGGGLATLNSSVTLNGTRFKGNIASENGGALWSENPLSFLISYISILNNEANQWGGGIFLSNAHQNPYIIKNNLFQGNQALNGGGIAISGQQASGIVANSTFVDNTTQEQGTDVAFDIDSAVDGNYLWSNIFAYGTGLSGVYVTETALASVGYNICWSSGDECMSVPADADDGSNLYEAPLFSLFIDDNALVGDDFSLQSTSSAIDSGPLDGEGPSYYSIWQDDDGTQNDRGYTGGQ
ncbi:MAG: hypothetical protein CL916_14990 [Deltaproteobacteria bacterium]|nr:hypothetical protein [Deltaproteobacteria bacterium]